MSTQAPAFKTRTLASAGSGSGALPRILAALARTGRRWVRQATTRRQLQRLPPHLYRDIGKTPAQVQREAQRPFWH